MNRYTWSDIHLGLKQSFQAVFTEEMVRSFARLSGDTNPLHIDAEYARSAGYPGPVVFGLMSSSLYSRLAGVHLPGKYALLQGIDVNFNAPCFLGEILVVEGEVTHLTEAYHRFEVRASIRKIQGALVSRAILRIGFHAE